MTSTSSSPVILLPPSTNEAVATLVKKPRVPSKTNKQRRFFRGLRRRKKLDVVHDDDDDETTLSEELNNLDLDVDLIPSTVDSNDDSSKQDSADIRYHRFLHHLLEHFHLSSSKGVTKQPGKQIQMEILQEYLHQDYTDLFLDSPAQFDNTLDGDSNMVAVNIHLDTCQHMLDDFWDFYQQVDGHTATASTADSEEMVVSVERRYQVVEVCSPKTLREIFATIQHYLRPRLLDLAQTPGETARLITWWEGQTHGCFDGKKNHSQLWGQLATSWKQQDLEWLQQRYLEQAVRKQLRVLLDRSVALNQDTDDLRLNQEGHAVTGHPESIVFMIRSQLAVAQEHLPSNYTSKVLDACNQELSRTVADLMLMIEAQWQGIGTTRFCAYMNDAARLTDLVEELHDEFSIMCDPMQIEQGGGLLRELTELSLHASRFLCQKIVWDLRRPRRRSSMTPPISLLTSIGSSEWEATKNHDFLEGTAIATAVATLRDYFAHIQKRLSSDYYYPKILKTCVDLTLQIYVESFFINTMTSINCDSLVASQSIQADYLRLVVFFNGETFADYFGRGGFYTQQKLNERVHTLTTISHILDLSKGPDELHYDVKGVLREFGHNGTPAVLHLAGMRKRRHSKTESVEWLHVIARAQKALAADLEQQQNSEETTMVNTTNAYYSLPDLRNSKQIRKVRHVASVDDLMSRPISTRSLEMAHEANRLLNVPRGVNRYLGTVANQIISRLDRQQPKAR